MHNHKERILILGAGLMQEPALRAANELGLETIAVDGNDKAPFASRAAQFFPIDLKDTDGLLRLGQRLRADGGLHAVFTAGTDFSASAAFVAENLGLPGNSYETALNTSSKARMRSLFAQEGVPSPRFIVLGRAEAAVCKFEMPFDFPVVVKPVDSMGGRGCRKVENKNGLQPALCDALAFSRSGEVIVEEYLDGPEFSVDSIVYEDSVYITGLADRHIFFPPYFIEMGHTMPSALEDETAGRLLATFKQAVRALGIRSGCAKGDIKLTAAGPAIGEIASRLSGGYMSGWTYPYASGVELTRAAILVALGRPKAEVEAILRPSRRHVSAERAFISIPGRVSAVHGGAAAEETAFVKNVFFRAARGDDVDFPRNNVSKCGNVISAAPTRKEAVEAAAAAARAIVLVLEYPDASTEEFLSGWREDAEDCFPPDAFPAPLELRRRCAALPPDICLSQDGLEVIPFPAFFESELRDWHGRTPRETLSLIRELSGLPLPFAGEKTGGALLGREFWQAVLRGGCQGGLYHLRARAARLRRRQKTLIK